MSLTNDSVHPWHSEFITSFDVRMGYGYVDGRYLILIGGSNGILTYKKYIDEPNVPLDMMDPMPSLHKAGASVLMKGQDFWILGGKDGSNVNTNQTHFLRDGVWHQGPSIDYNAYGICAVNYADKFAILIGGVDQLGAVLLTVQAYNLYPDPSDEGLTKFKLANLREAKYNMACLSYDHDEDLRIIVAGGITEFGTLTNSVDIYHNEKKKWYMIENLPRLSALGSMLLQDDVLYYFGGMADDKSGDGTIYYMENLENWENVTALNVSEVTYVIDLNGTLVYYDENGEEQEFLSWFDYTPGASSGNMTFWNSTSIMAGNITSSTNTTDFTNQTVILDVEPEFWKVWGQISGFEKDRKYYHKAIVLPFSHYFVAK